MNYGSLLGEYFAVASRLTELETAYDAPDPVNHAEYHRLREERDRLKQQLDAMSGSNADTDVKQVLDEAFEKR